MSLGVVYLARKGLQLGKLYFVDSDSSRPLVCRGSCRYFGGCESDKITACVNSFPFVFQILVTVLQILVTEFLRHGLGASHVRSAWIMSTVMDEL